MVRPVAIVGIGELGAIFARGFLRLGHPVYPVTRTLSAETVARSLPDPALVLVSVGEADLAGALTSLPRDWRSRVALVQNELLPRDWLANGIADPTLVVVWFEKKPTTLVKELLPSVVFGPNSGLAAEALAAVGIATRTARDSGEILNELIQKNFYILLSNIAGLETGGSVSELWKSHRALAERVANDVIELQGRLAKVKPSREALFAGFERAVAADPTHLATGRSAPARLSRALAHADALGVDVPELRRIAKQVR